MTLKELSTELIALEASNSDAPVEFKWVSHESNSTVEHPAVLVDARIIDGVAVIRIANPSGADAIRQSDPHQL